jgi:periplasmic divalent cation tolerance protein
MSENDPIVILSTCPNWATAEKLAKTLVENGICACANIIPGLTSIYRWKGEICRDNEIFLIIKTIRRLYPEVEKTIKLNHPYEVPEIVVLPIVEGSEEYISWLKACGK